MSPPQASPTKFCNFAGPDWCGIKGENNNSPPWGERATAGGAGGKNIAFYVLFGILYCMYKYNKNLTGFARANRRAGNLAEALLWNELKQSKLGYGFTKQKPIGNYIADFYCSEKKLVIEVDGWTHDEKVEYDANRDEYMKSLGIYVLRVNDIDVKQDINGVLYLIKYYLDNL